MSGKTPMATFSVVPFSTSVNVGTGYANASWMDTTGLIAKLAEFPSVSRQLAADVAV